MDFVTTKKGITMKNFFIAAIIVGSAALVTVGLVGTSSASDAGAETLTRVFDVEGMTCGGCEVAVKRSVGKLEGVDTVKASHEDGRAEVTYDPGKVTIEQIVEAIEKLGYQAKVEEKRG